MNLSVCETKLTCCSGGFGSCDLDSEFRGKTKGLERVTACRVGMNGGEFMLRINVVVSFSLGFLKKCFIYLLPDPPGLAIESQR